MHLHAHTMHINNIFLAYGYMDYWRPKESSEDKCVLNRPVAIFLLWENSQYMHAESMRKICFLYNLCSVFPRWGLITYAYDFCCLPSFSQISMEANMKHNVWILILFEVCQFVFVTLGSSYMDFFRLIMSSP